MKTLKNKLLVALVVAFMLTLGAAIIPTVGMQVNAAETDSVQITLTDGIAVKYYATLGADVTEATATFESETTALNATVKGEKVGDRWLFVYNKVTPQYIDATLSVKVNGETKVENYSVLTYLNTIINGEYAEAEKTVAKDLVYYGEAAKAYKLGGTVAATPGTAYNGESKMNLGAKFADDTQIYSATVVFDTLPAITFGFKKASETATVTVDGKDVTNELAKGENGVYTYTLTGIYAIDFDKQYTVVLTDGENTQTLSYSINDYAARMLSSTNEAMRTLAKALYCYGAGAQALKTYQEAYVVVTAPTYTETGVAKNGKGEEISLPVLNAANYNFTQVAADGTEYKYNNGQGGKAYFTHKTYSEIVIEKEITADTITFGYKDYNNVDIHWKVAENFSSKLTGAYVDGAYVLTIVDNNNITIPNMTLLNSKNLPNVKITGKGSLTVSASAGTINDLTVDGVKFDYKKEINVKNVTVTSEKGDLVLATLNATGDIMVKGGTLTVTNGNLAIKSNKTLEVSSGATLNVNGRLAVGENASIEVSSGATLNVTTDNGDVMHFIGGGKSVAKFYGTVNLSYTGTGDKTGISCDYRSKSGVSIYLSDTSRVNIQAGNNAIGSWSKAEGANNNIYVYYPSTATYSAGEKKITSESGNVLLTYKGKADYNVGFRKVN